jgi:hypothetical protein
MISRYDFICISQVYELLLLSHFTGGWYPIHMYPITYVSSFHMALSQNYHQIVFFFAFDFSAVSQR